MGCGLFSAGWLFVCRFGCRLIWWSLESLWCRKLVGERVIRQETSKSARCLVVDASNV